MKNKIVFFFTLLLVQSYNVVQAQTTDLLYTWAKALGSNQPIGGEIIANGIQTDASGNVYITGYFSGTADFDPGAGVIDLISKGNSDIFFAKYGASGNYVFAKSIGGIQNDISNAIAIDGSGNIYITGNFSGTADFDPGAGVIDLTSKGSIDIFFAKYTSAGDYVFAKSMGGASSENSFSIAIDSNSNIYITGWFLATVDFDPGATTVNLTSAGSFDIFIAKYDVLGNYVYAKRMGDTGEDLSSSIVVDASGSAYITGNFSGTADFDPGVGIVNLVSAGEKDIFLAKYNATGDYVFAKRIGGTGADISRSIAIDASSNCYITGEFRTTVDFDPGAATVNLTTAVAGSTTAVDIFFAKYTTAGIYVYAKRIGSTLEVNRSSFAITVDGSGNAYITGSFGGTVDFNPAAAIVNLTATYIDIFLAKYNATGLYVYAKRIGSLTAGVACNGFAITTDTSGNAYIAGSFRDTVDFDPGSGTANLISGYSITNSFAGKYNTTGLYVWAKSFGGYNSTIYNDSGNSIARDGSGNIYITGTFEDTVDFDPGAGITILTSAGSSDIFLAKYSANGVLIYAKRMGGTSLDQAKAIAVDGNGNAYITGQYGYTADFDPGPGTVNLTNSQGYGIFIAKYDATGNYVYAKSIDGSTGANISNAIVIDLSGNAYITGHFEGTVDFDPGVGVVNLTSAGGWDIFVAKYNASGNYVFAKGIGGIYGDDSTSIALDGNGNSCIIGHFSNTVDFDTGTGITNLDAINGKMFLAKYDASGNFVFAKQMGGEIFTSIAIDTSDNTYITGAFLGTADFNPGAGIANLTSIGGRDIFFAKYDSLGNYVFAKQIGGTNDGFGRAITLDSSNNIYITGNFNGVSDFDPGIGIANLNVIGLPSENSFISKYDIAGNYIYAKKMGERGNSIATDGIGNVYVTGYFSNTSDFDPSAGLAELNASNGKDIFFARYTESYLINASAGSNGTISPSGNTYVLASGSQVYTITPSSGFYILDVLVNGVSNAAAIATGTYTFLNVTTSHTISVTFAPVCVNATVPTISASSIINCGAVATTLSIISGNLNSANNWQWYSGSCGGTLVGSGTTISVTPAATTTYFVRGEGGCVTSGGCASITITVSCFSIVNLKLFIEGYYDETTMRSVKFNQDGISPLTDVEDITVELHNATSPWATVASTTALLKTDGTAVCTFNTAPNGIFYIAVKTRNTVQTWSATAQNVGPIPLTYDFSPAANKAYGNNMIEIETNVWAFYCGDLDGDGFLDVPDYSIWENDYNIGAVGVFSTDLDGDGFVDVPDYSIWENNYINGKTSIYPQN